MAKQGPMNQHILLHQHYPNNCCLCKAEQSYADLLKNSLTEVYIVGTSAVDSNEIISVHKTYQGALDAWNNQRLKLLEWYKEGIGRDEMYIKMAENMKCENPEEIDNGVHEAPYIKKITLAV